jgi:hypothetical protein
MPTKVRITGKDIFEDTRHEMFISASNTVQVPIIKKQFIHLWILGMIIMLV